MDLLRGDPREPLNSWASQVVNYGTLAALCNGYVLSVDHCKYVERVLYVEYNYYSSFGRSLIVLYSKLKITAIETLLVQLKYIYYYQQINNFKLTLSVLCY
jgi:hypothetical protein